MLDSRIIEGVRVIILNDRTQRHRQLVDELNTIRARASMQGAGRGTGVLRQLATRCEDELRSRAKSIWETLKRVTESYTDTPPPDLAVDLERAIRDHVRDETGLVIKNFHGVGGATGQQLQFAQNLADDIAAIGNELSDAYAGEVRVFVSTIARRATDAARARASTVIINVGNNYGAIQTGAGAHASITTGISTTERSAVIAALDLIDTNLSAASAAAHVPVTDLKDVVRELRDEVQTRTPNRLRIGALLSTVGTVLAQSVQTAGALIGAYEAVRIAAALFGHTLPQLPLPGT